MKSTISEFGIYVAPAVFSKSVCDIIWHRAVGGVVVSLWGDRLAPRPKNAPAFSAFPPSMAVRAAAERSWMTKSASHQSDTTIQHGTDLNHESHRTDAPNMALKGTDPF
ncbi:hypothetical protein [Nitrincola sp. A-D6]|uniref:hypothetical protein n=1 Tax=Nitrincola sp. A-D6 TaxID=1545442 RepID=UPI001184AEAA|nr:hypothetical protein [Nitrincola sp. A-D6]